MHDTEATKRIPKSLGTDTKLFGTYTLADAAVGLLPAVVVVLVTQAILPSSVGVAGYSIRALTVPLAGLAVAVGAVFVYLTPAYLSSVEWLETIFRYRRSDTEISHEEAKEYTQIEQIHPKRGAIERADGAFVGMIHVEPPTMALATDDEWSAKAESFEDFLNTAVDFPIQIYSTTQSFPADAYLDHYESRLADPDVQGNPQLAALIEHYVEWYATELDDRRMTIRDHYVIVAVRPEEVQFDRESLLDKLADLPVLGVLVQAWFAPRVEAQREAMFDALDERLRRIETGIRGIEGCNATRVTVEDAVTVIGEFWAGEQFEYGDLSSTLRTTPVVRGETNG